MIRDRLLTIRTALLLVVSMLAIWILCMAASGYASARMLYCIFSNPHRAWILAIAHDQLANAAANGDPDETISSRADRARGEGKRWGCVLCRVLDWISKDHCRKSNGT